MEYLIDCRWNSTTPVEGYQLVPGHAVNLRPRAQEGGHPPLVGWDQLEERAADTFRSFGSYFNEYGGVTPSWLFDREGAYAGAVMRLARILLGPQHILVPNERVDRAAGECEFRIFDAGRRLPENLVVCNVGPSDFSLPGVEVIQMPIRDPVMEGYWIEDLATLVCVRLMQVRAALGPRPLALYLGPASFEAAALVRTSGKLNSGVFSRVFIRDGRGGAREIHVVNWLDEKERRARLDELAIEGDPRTP